MSISLIGEVLNAAPDPGGGSGATSVGVTVARAPGAGNLVVMRVAETNQNTSSASDSRGNTWARQNALLGGIPVTIFWTLQNTAALQVGDTITVTFAGTVFHAAIIVDAFSSSTGWLAAPVDVTASAAGAGTSRDGGTTATTSQASELAVAAYAINAAETAFTPASGSAFTTPFKSNGANVTVEGFYKILTATGPQHLTATGGASAASAGLTVTFKPAAAPPPSGSPTRTLLGVGT